MTNPKFKSVVECLGLLPESERQITQFLRQIVLDNLPNCTEKLSYNVPYYFLNKSICFIWPGSVLWGKTVWMMVLGWDSRTDISFQMNSAILIRKVESLSFNVTSSRLKTLMLTW